MNEDQIDENNEWKSTKRRSTKKKSLRMWVKNSLKITEIEYDPNLESENDENGESDSEDSDEDL